MNTFLSILVAGLLGGATAIGIAWVGFGSAPAQKIEMVRTVEPLDAEPEASARATNSRDEEIADLKRQLAVLEVRIGKPADSSTDDEIAALRKEVEALKLARAVTSVPETAEGEAAVAISPAPAATPEFDSAVRDAMTRIAEERADARRLEAQAERLAQLEQQKTQIAEFVPQLVKNQSAKLNIPEASIPGLSNVLVIHAQMRAELTSEMRGLRIDGEEVDDEAYKLKFEELNRNTIAALSSYVDVETADKLVNSLDRAARNNRDDSNNSRKQGREKPPGRRGN